MFRRFAWLGALLLAAPLFLSPAAANDDARAAQLDGLFDALAASESAEEAAAVEAQIWRIWAYSGSPTVDLLMQRGLEAMASQEYAVALDLFSTVIDLAPDYAEAWSKRATLFYLIDDYEAAIADVTQTLVREPRHWAALMGLAVMFEDMGEDERALSAYRTTLQINPQLETAREAVERLSVAVDGRRI